MKLVLISCRPEPELSPRKHQCDDVAGGFGQIDCEG
jgi:hypothetical protein